MYKNVKKKMYFKLQLMIDLAVQSIVNLKLYLRVHLTMNLIISINMN